MGWWRPLLLAGAIAVWGAVWAPAATAQAPIEVSQQQAENAFPQGVRFRLTATAEGSVQEARLRYRLLPDGVPALIAAEVTPGPRVEVSLELGWPRLYIPPGTTIEYSWELRDAQGNMVETPVQSFTYTDPRFPFQVEESGPVRLHWYAGGREQAQRLLQTARETLERLQALLGTQVSFPVQVWAYASPQDMREALPRRSEAYEARVVTAGMKVSSDTVLLAIGSGGLDTLRHELAHIVTAAAGEGPFGDLPAWLDEGTAVYAQEDPGGYRLAFERARRQDALLPLASLGSYPGDASKVDLFYGQSWAFVSYLIETYGEERFARLFATFKRGATVDQALVQVYGMDTYDLENAWRQSLGLPPRPRPQAPANGPVPTVPPSTGPVASPGASGTDWGLLGGIIGGALATAGLIGLGGYALYRRLS
jgi:hypothetical protein